MNSDEVRAAREIIAAATPGPWAEKIYITEHFSLVNSCGPQHHTSLNGQENMERAEADAKFIAAARTGWPQALDAAENWQEVAKQTHVFLKERMDEVERLRAALEFYANKRNYFMWPDEPGSRAFNDRGARARAALSRSETDECEHFFMVYKDDLNKPCGFVMGHDGSLSKAENIIIKCSKCGAPEPAPEAE